jgi:hypothetical protein
MTLATLFLGKVVKESMKPQNSWSHPVTKFMVWILPSAADCQLAKKYPALWNPKDHRRGQSSAQLGCVCSQWNTCTVRTRWLDNNKISEN